MPVIWLKLPEIQKPTDSRPHDCPYCGSDILQRWGRVTKPVRDATGLLTEIYRYRCSECERTFRHYPEGVDRSNQTLRIRQIAGLAWVMGMSTRDVVDAFRNVGLKVSRTSVWREGKRLSERQDDRSESLNGKRYSIDRNYVHRVSTKLGVVVALSAKDGREVVLGTLDEYNPRGVKSWMESLIEGIDIEISVLGTGTLDEYETTEVVSYLGSYI
ncbi:MAG: transposase family protein [Anaerolineales bacterium]|nr:transposase family protein [Anaerolineales bacterium]